MIVHCIGDSHVRVFRKSPGFLTYGVASFTAWNISVHRVSIDKIISSNVQPEHWILFIFGCIDCNYKTFLPIQSKWLGLEEAVRNVWTVI